ncbi:nucleoside diphosphate kinase A-like [Salarias fasciatus]|uniref:Nucleoside diphosphate kinase n=1 Tax=Salarias fasciatus TaxID=181472 RepID=A0A672G6H9_SALFA|nr:nucleoside diphosphate kinase A-like [Salarias fasciatus]
MLQLRVFVRVLQQSHVGNQGPNKAFPLAHSAGRRNTSTAPPAAAERTLIAVKPDGVQRGLVGKIIQRFEQRGFKLVGIKMLQVSKDLLSEHYCELRAKPFYPDVQAYMTSGPVIAMVWEGDNVVQTSRSMVGPTDPTQAQSGTIRGDFSIHVSRNVVHASDSLEGAQREIQLWFEGKDLLDWDCCSRAWTHRP